MAQKFSPGQKAKLDIDYASAGTYLTPSSTIATSQLAIDSGLLVGSVNIASFLSTFAAKLSWGLWVDSKASGTNGGTFTSGSWATRVLNTASVNTITGASLAANQVTLPAGTYLVFFSAPAYNVDVHACQLYDATGSATLARGSSEFSWQSGTFSTVTRSIGMAVITLAVASVLELQHRCATTYVASGLGLACNFGDAEIYSQLLVIKVA